MLGRGVISNVFSGSLTTGLRNLMSPSKIVGTYAKGFQRIGQTLTQRTLGVRELHQMGRRSAQLLGTTAGLVYGVRAVRGATGGPGLIRDRKGKRDIIPFMPFI